MKTRYLLFFLLCIVGYQIIFAQSVVSATKTGTKVDVFINNNLFTSYIFSKEEKYPFFFPLNGPSNASVTSMRNANYPHHSSLFFGCDKVNGGNYWQEGLREGQILSLRADIIEQGKDKVIIENECIWTRPEAVSPIKDFRTITISAPEKDLFQIDFVITMEMLQDVNIQKTNHSLFSARMDSDLSVLNGGTMINAEGEISEKETFGKPSAWMDYYGKRGSDYEGLTIMQHPKNLGYPAPWFTRDYGFISPTAMYWPENETLGTNLKKGEKLKLRYRVLVHRGDHVKAKIKENFEKFSKD